MEKWKAMYIQEQCNRISGGVDNLNRIDKNKKGLKFSKNIMLERGIELIAAALKRPVKIRCSGHVYFKEVSFGGVRFSQMGFYAEGYRGHI